MTSPYRTKAGHRRRRSRVRCRLQSYRWATSRSPRWRRLTTPTPVPPRQAREIAIASRREQTKHRAGLRVL